VTNINKLPPELLERIFSMLSFTDRKTAVLVCRWWAEVGQVPKLWSWVHFKVRGWKLTRVIEMMARRRMKKVESLKLEYSLTVVTDQLMIAILDHPAISEIDLSGTDLTSVHPKLLANVVCQLRQVSLAGSLLTLQQNETLFATLAKLESSSLGRLDISGLDLTLVTPEYLAAALTKLEQVSLAGSWLCQDQLRAIFRALSTSSTTSTTTLEQGSRLISSSSTPPSTLSPRSKSKSGSTTKQKTLRMLNLRGVSLTFLDPSTFSRALSQLEEVDLTDTRLTRLQRRQVCHFLLRPSKIKKLWIDGYSFSCGSQNVISDAVYNLQNNEVNLIGNRGLNNNAIANINNASNNVDGNENRYEAPIAMRLKHNLMAGVA